MSLGYFLEVSSDWSFSASGKATAVSNTRRFPTRLFRNLKYDAIVACASIGGMLLLNDSCVADHGGCTVTTNAQEIDWLSLSTFLQFANT